MAKKKKKKKKKKNILKKKNLPKIKIPSTNLLENTKNKLMIIM